jgi:hypothetical protein
MQEIITEALKAIENINELINFNLFEEEFTSKKNTKRLEDVSHNYMLEFCSIGDACAINFMGQQIWNSEDDEREYNDDKDCHAETIERYIFNQMNKILSIDLRLIEKALNK